MEILKIDNLHVDIDNKKIIKGLSLSINKGEVHALMGQNGCGKSTLAKTITGHFSVNVRDGGVTYKNRNLLEMEPEERANRGIFNRFLFL